MCYTLYNTEEYFGLVNVDGKISADNGETFLPDLSEMTDVEFDELVEDIEYWKGEELSERDLCDLKLILDVGLEVDV